MNTRKINMMESYTTYENHGELVLNFELFPELVGKTDEEIQGWLNQNSEELFIHVDSMELRKDKKYVYTLEDLEEAKANGEEIEDFEDDEVIELSECQAGAEVLWDKIKNERKYLHLC